jgi:hypothetical protein
MSHPPGTGVCQGNFAASVKEILPIHEYGALAVMASSERFTPRMPKIRDIRPLTGDLYMA